MTTNNDLLPCPFCGCEMHVDPVARDWWRLYGYHDEDCMLYEQRHDAPQTDEQKALLIAAWNTRQPAMPADAWQPIETAPKHTEVLVWREDSGPFIAKFTDPYEVISVEEMDREGLEFPDDYEEWWSDAYGWQEGSERPTHWMPLHAGPDARRRIEGES